MMKSVIGVVRSDAPARRGRRLWCAVLALCVGVLGLLPTAQAELLSYAATDFVQRCPCDIEGDHTEVKDGVLVLVDINLRYFRSVDLPEGEQVCQFTLIYHDINGNDTMTAHLVRKAFTVGGDPFSSPQIMATVSSASGVSNTVRKATTTTITDPTITKENAFYYVELDAPTINLNALGVQIDVRPSCH